MADGKVTIDTSIDTSGVDKGLKNVTQKLNGFKGKLQNADFMKLGAAVAGVGVAFKAVSTAVKTTVNEIKQLEAAYKKQKTAEVQLNTAVKNSPLMNGESARNMRDLASELQKVSTYGDEQLIPFMTQLINSGRSEAETMDIMRAAVDVAASGMMDLGSAVNALNMTYQGTAGTLGRQISSIKNLTAEELKAGKAVEIIKAQFAGTAEEVAKATGSAEQLANAWGDLREELGAGWEKPLSKVRGWLQDILEKAKETLNARRMLAEANDAGDAGTIEQLQTRLNAKIDERNQKYKELLHIQDLANGTAAPNDEDLQKWRTANNAIQNAKQSVNYLMKQYLELNTEVGRQTNLLQAAKAAEEAKTQAEKDAAAAAEKEAARIKANADSTQNYYNIIKKRNETVETLEREAAVMGEEVDQQAILNAYMSAYLEMAKDPNLKTKTAEHLAEVQGMAEAYKMTVEEMAQLENFREVLNGVDVSEDIKKSDVLREQLALMDELNNAVVNSANFDKLSADEKTRLYSEYAQKRKQLEKEITEAVEEENEVQKTSITEIVETVKTAVDQILNTIQSITSTFSERNEAIAEQDQLVLEKKYRDGLITEKEYYKEKDKLEREAAQKQYEKQMWEWSASLVQIGTNTAQAISKALAEGGTVAGVAMAALIGTMGAAQLAAALGNKPIPPKFANGGIVGGTSYNGDRVTANVNSGEMILNARQQLALWKTANGQGNGGANMNVQIKNYASNDTTVTPQLTEQGLIIAVRKIVSDDLQNRKLNGALAVAQNTMNGINYEN